MPRCPRVFAEGTFYHVSNHTVHGESPFLDRREAEGFVERVREAKARDGFAVFAWCLMSNHYHLVVRTGQIPFSRSLLLIQQRVALSLDGREKVTGSGWQARYRARPIRRRRALDGAVAYVHLNPVAAGLTADPACYRWSGHRELLGLEAPRVVDVDLALARFGALPEEARRAYVELLRRERSSTWIGTQSRRRPWWLADGAPAEGSGPEPVRPLWRLDAWELLTLAGSVLDVSALDLASPRRGSRLLRARMLLAVVAAKRLGVGSAALAQALGRSADCVRRWVSRGAQECAHDPAFSQELDEVERRLLAAGALTPP